MCESPILDHSARHKPAIPGFRFPHIRAGHESTTKALCILVYLPRSTRRRMRWLTTGPGRSLSLLEEVITYHLLFEICHYCSWELLFQ